MGFQECIALTILVSGILSIWPTHPSLCALAKLIVFLCFIILSTSWLVFIRQKPFSHVGPNIFLHIFLSKIISLWFIVYLSAHVSHAYATVGLITEKYCCTSPLILLTQENFNTLDATFECFKYSYFHDMSIFF
jgi:hypothetical protein